MFHRVFLTLTLLSISFCAIAQKMDAKIIQRMSNETGYSRYIPGQSFSSGNASANCNAYGSSVNCSGSSNGQSTYTAPRTEGYNVTGATLTLLLPDGRQAVVNCVSKYAFKMDSVNRRGCRTPLTDTVSVEFSGKNAKLRWPVSIDGKKTETETYVILGVLPAVGTPTQQ